MPDLTLKPVMLAKKEMADVLDNHLTMAMRKAEELHPELAGKTDGFLQSKQNQGMIIEAEKGLFAKQKLEAIKASQPFFNPQNIGGMFVGLATGHIGVTGGYLAGRLLGAPVGDAIMSPLVSAAYRSGLSSRIAGIAQKSSSELRNGVSKFFQESKKRAPAAASKPIKERLTRDKYQNAYDAVVHLSSQEQAAKIQKSASEIAEIFPTLGNQSMKSYYAAQQYLAAARPPNDIQGMSLVKAPKAAGMSLAEHEYFDKMTAVLDPKSVIKSLSDGTLTHSQVDAVKAVYPEMYGEVVDSVKTHIANLRESGKTMPYNKVIQLGILLGQPMDPTQEPDMVRAFQDSYAPPPDKGGRPKGSTSSSDTDTASETKTEQLEK